LSVPLIHACMHGHHECASVTVGTGAWRSGRTPAASRAWSAQTCQRRL
jgi:DNA-nicking Smr family endonuclease